MYKQLEKREDGAVSMITVIFVAIVLTILTTSFIRLSINEQRQATDDDLTTRAYYAAESGVQDAINAINDGVTPAELSTFSDCGPVTGNGVLSTSSNLDTAYTCQTIDMAPTDYQAYLDDGETVFFKLDANTPITSVEISWHIKGDTNDSDGSQIALRNGTDLPEKDNWNNGTDIYPAMLRTQLIAVPATIPVTRASIDNFVGFLNPHQSGLGTIGSLSALDSGITNTDCDTSVLNGEYVCSIEIQGLDDATNDYYLRVQTLYRPTHVKIVARAGGADVAILNAQAVIDVTGRAGDVYRRVEERVSLVPDSLWPNYAILSAEEICKDFVITDRRVGNATNPGFTDVNPSINGSCRQP